MVNSHTSTYDAIILNFFPIIKRRRKILYTSFLAAILLALGFHYLVGPRYEAYVLLRVGQGIKDRTPGQVQNMFDGVDLTARIDSVARIGMTDYVIREAATPVGLLRLSPKPPSSLEIDARALVAKWANAIQAFFPAISRINPSTTPEPNAINSSTSTRQIRDPTSTIVEGLREDLTARQEGRSDILRISFRGNDPATAAEFVNSLGHILIANYADVTQISGAGSFFQQQTTRLEQEADEAAAALHAFSSSTQIYSVSDQRSFLLKRINDLATQLTAVRGSVVEKKGFKQAVVDDLLLLRPVYQSKTVTGIVKNIAGSGYQQNKGTMADTNTDYGELPPILLVKVYQENMSVLMKVNADLTGLETLESTLGSEIDKVNDELASLVSKEAEYNRLRSALTRASTAAENYAIRTNDEKISADISKRAQLSSVRIVQSAEVPVTPVFPKTWQLILLTIVLGLGSGAISAVALELASNRSSERNPRNDNNQVVTQLGPRYYRRDELLDSAE